MLKASDIEKIWLVNLFLKECAFKLFITNFFIDFFSQNKLNISKTNLHKSL